MGRPVVSIRRFEISPEERQVILKRVAEFEDRQVIRARLPILKKEMEEEL